LTTINLPSKLNSAINKTKKLRSADCRETVTSRRKTAQSTSPANPKSKKAGSKSIPLKTNEFHTENFRTPQKQRSYSTSNRRKAPKSSKFPPKSAEKRHFGLGSQPLSPLVPQFLQSCQPHAAHQAEILQLLLVFQRRIAGSTESPVSCCGDMESSQNVAAVSTGFATLLLLAIDTCGPSGSVALGRSIGPRVEILGHFELEGRTYSSTVITAVANLLNDAGITLKDLAAIVAVHGPGSFTGVRIGLSAVKGLAEPLQIPVAVVSRLHVLASKTGLQSAALDAHRGEVFLRITIPTTASVLPAPVEILAGTAELKAINPFPPQVAVCDEPAAALLASVWPATKLIQVLAPTASDALYLAAPRVVAGAFADLALLDGHYLRRSDAEIFGDAAEAKHA
jgi:tRNA threonylcarbamoyladenosine biosynthesis protein TsaB